jgi:hypothetical protein
MKKGRCTRVENPGGILEVFAKIPRGGGSRVSGKIAWGGGGLPILGFIAFLLTSFSKICLGGSVSYPLPPYPSLRASTVVI